MVTAADVGGTEFAYILRADREAIEANEITEAEATTWTLRVLSHHEQKKIEKMQSLFVPQDDRDPYMQSSNYEISCEAFQMGFISVGNFNDRNGQPVTIERDGKGRLPNEAFERVKFCLTELSTAIVNRGKVTVNEAKN